MTVKGRSVLVTGAAKRIGRAIAIDLARSGANVAIHYRNSEHDASAAVEEARSFGVKSRSFAADLTSASAVDSLIHESREFLGSLDIVVSAAAVFKKTPWADVTEADWDYHFDANLKTTFLLARSASRVMSDGSSFVTMGDWSGIRSYRGYLPYCVSKAGVIALTKALAQELAPRIRVNCVCPGTVLPPEHASPEAIDRIRQRTPLGRIGDPADVVAAVRFFVDGTTFATGSVLVVDGGRLVADPGYG